MEHLEEDKIVITRNQAAQFNRMRVALIKISREYQNTTQIKLASEEQYGLEYEEALEMAFENMQNEANFAVNGVRAIGITPKQK